MSLKIAFMGIRGIPKGYSGFETFVRELAPRLAQRGHDVTVYGRSYHMEGAGDEYRGVRLVSLPTIRSKHL
ncbi:MAG: glycosyltransferase, partial [Nitrospinota bacterium]|nr:glycosyltransferase [Nitrospinota bacterium]